MLGLWCLTPLLTIVRSIYTYIYAHYLRFISFNGTHMILTCAMGSSKSRCTGTFTRCNTCTAILA